MEGPSTGRGCWKSGMKREGLEMGERVNRQRVRGKNKMETKMETEHI